MGFLKHLPAEIFKSVISPLRRRWKRSSKKLSGSCLRRNAVLYGQVRSHRSTELLGEYVMRGHRCRPKKRVTTHMPPHRTVRTVTSGADTVA